MATILIRNFGQMKKIEDNQKLIQLVKENVISWDVRNDELKFFVILCEKLSEREPMLWEKIAEDFGTDSDEYTINYYSSIYLVKLY